MPYTGTLTVPKWNRLSRLLSSVSWLWDSDLDEGPKPAWDMTDGEEKTSCWTIPLYEKNDSTHAFLLMHAKRGNGNDGGDITLSISGTARYDAFAKGSFEIAQSQPIRHVYRVDADWWREENP